MIPVAYDLETHLATRGVSFPRIVCGSMAAPNGQAAAMTRSEAVTTLVGLSRATDVVTVGTYLAYDYGCVLEEIKHDYDSVKAIWDAMRAGRLYGVDIAQMLIDISKDRFRSRENRGYGLVTVSGWNDLPMEEKGDDHPWRKHFGQLDGTPLALYPASALEYILDDVTRPLEILERQSAKDKHSVLHLVGQETWCQIVLGLVGSHGVRTNAARVKIGQEQTEDRIAAYREMLEKAPENGFEPAVRPDGTKNIKATRAYMETVYARAQAEPPQSDGGDTSLARNACIGSGSEYLIAYAEYTSAKNLRSRFETLAEGIDHPLQTSFTPLRVTGRTSSRKPKEPHVGHQAQNWPRGKIRIRDRKNPGQWITIDIGARECLQPREGCAYLWADFEGAETHTLADACYQKFGFSEIGKRLNAGIDEHTFFGARVFERQPYDVVKALPNLKAIRNKAKPFVFGKPGGMGAANFVFFAYDSYGQIFSLEEAKYYGSQYFDLCPEVRLLHKWVGQQCELGGGKCTIRLPNGFVRGGCYFTDGCNLHFQGPCAFGAKAALCHVAYECYADRDSPLYGFRIINMVHDEIVLEGPIHMVHWAGVRLKFIMQREFNIYTPNFPTGVEVIAGDTWSKDAKPVYDRNGYLDIWHYQEAA